MGDDKSKFEWLKILQRHRSGTLARSEKPQVNTPEKSCCVGTCDPIGVDISIMRHKEYGRRVCMSGDDDLGKKLPRLFLGKSKSLSPIVGTLSIMPVNKAVLGLLSYVHE